LTTRLRSTATPRSGAHSTTTTGRRSTSSTQAGASATSTSAKDATSNPSALIRELLGIERELTAAEGVGVEAEDDWDQLRTPETYLGYGRGNGLASPNGQSLDERRPYELPRAWASTAGPLPASGRSGASSSCSTGCGQHRLPLPRARRASRALTRRARGDSLPRALDGEATGQTHGVDVDEDGNGLLREAASTTRAAAQRSP
jgi:hypothetical protein